MMQVLKQAPKTKHLLDSSNDFYQDLLGYKPEQTSLEQIPENQWIKFTRERGLNSNSPGIYFPRNQSAVIKEENPLSLFHEYFGHGLYCEQNLTGRRLVDLERKLLEEEKQEFQGRQFILEDIQKFRQQNKTFQELDELRKQNLGVYELFAIWTEYLLSDKHGLKDEFGMKYDSLRGQEKESVDSAINFSEQYGNLATFYEFGLGKVQDKERLLKLSKEIFNGKLDETNLILHFGSGKPFSDIDFFIISNKIEPSYCDWLDIRAYKPEDAEEKIKLLDSRVTDPIIVGSLIFGNKEY